MRPEPGGSWLLLRRGGRGAVRFEGQGDMVQFERPIYTQILGEVWGLERKSSHRGG